MARRARFVMSHATGKIEMLAVDQENIYLRYHRAKDPAMRGKFVICARDDKAYWLDDLEQNGSFDSPQAALETLRQSHLLAAESGLEFPN